MRKSTMRKSYVGLKYGRLTVTGEGVRIKGDRIVNVRCVCGIEKTVKFSKIRCGDTTSCGCYAREKMSERRRTHKLTKHPLYNVRTNMIRRCEDTGCDSYIRYGARGVSICQEWRNDFLSFYNWAISNGWQKGLQIDRINNDGSYEPENCRCVTPKVNSRNKRNSWLITFKNTTKPLIAWCEELHKNYNKVRARMYAGWSFETAIDLDND